MIDILIGLCILCASSIGSIYVAIKIYKKKENSFEYDQAHEYNYQRF